MDYYKEIKGLLINNEVYKTIKDYSKNKSDLDTYYNVGKKLSEAGSKYGEDIIGEYSRKLQKELNKKYDRRTLRRYRQFYNFSINLKWSPLATKLSWSHYTELLSLKDTDEILYYIHLTIENNLSKRELRNRIKFKEYERLPIKTRNKIITNDKLELKDLVPNPILIFKKENEVIVTEKALHNLILENVPLFLKELGNGFSFIDSEYKIKIGDRYNYIDLLLFNIKFNSYVIIELKVTELKAEYIAQVKKYMNYVDKNIKEINNNPTIGIIICKKDNKFVIEYCSDERITIREYKII